MARGLRSLTLVLLLATHLRRWPVVTFRGDAHHRVRPFAAAADDRRVSIVLESYVLPRLDIWRARRLVPTFQVG